MKHPLKVSGRVSTQETPDSICLFPPSWPPGQTQMALVQDTCAPPSGTRAQVRAKEDRKCPVVRARAQLSCYPGPGSTPRPPFNLHSVSTYCMPASLPSASGPLGRTLQPALGSSSLSPGSVGLQDAGGGDVGRGAIATSRATQRCGDPGAVMRMPSHTPAKGRDESLCHS